jgi:hypothetical protein
LGRTEEGLPAPEVEHSIDRPSLQRLSVQGVLSYNALLPSAAVKKVLS